MNSRRLNLVLATAIVAFAGLVLGGCAPEKIGGTPVQNIKPTVRLTQAPFDDGSSYFYAFRMNWIGHDPDGRVEYFIYAIDPDLNRPETIQWTRTTKNEQILFFTATVPDPAASQNRSIDFHTFAIRAVDDDGDSSEVVTRSFFSFTVAPTVNITNPLPSSLLTIQLTPAVRISWTGTDPDGQFTTKPIKYKYTLLTSGSEFPIDIALTDPDSVRRFYAPAFAGWDSTPADTTEVQYTNLTPGAEFIFVVVAFDEAGAYSPIFSFNSNMLRFRAGFAGTLGPRITMFNEFFNFSYASGGFSTDPQREVFLEVPAGELVNFNWFASPPPGSDISSYRWALDIANVDDNTPREDEERDLDRWSSASLLTQKATVGPFNGGEEHRFYIEALDSNNLRSLGIVRFQVVASTFDKPLAIVDDTRFIGDDTQPGTGGCVKLPLGVWPTAAELDTFLFARGGNPWKCYPSGTMSTAGVFAGYPFDTIGTRTGANEALVRLSILGQYQHVVWVVDGKSANNFKPGSDPFNPITSLRYMSSPGRFNSLAAYVKQGGKVWLMGGGGAMSTLIPWDQAANNAGGITFSNAQGELIPGRFMYDLAAWRSEVKVVTASLFINRFLGRNPSYPGAPPFASLPSQMRPRNSSTDPFPPGRTGQSQNVFYRTTYDAEFLSQNNFVLEDLNPDPDITNEQSVLDTLYEVITFSLPPTTARRVCMTYYHGVQSESFVFTGFAPWDFTRADCVAVIDFVLNGIWGLTRTAPVAAAPAVTAPVRAPANMQVVRPTVQAPLGGARSAPPGRAGGTVSSRE